jgi:O-antigen ligase
MGTIFNEEQDKTEFTGSAEARRVVMEEGLKVFAQFPLTGVGAGQFKNYNPPERRERWRETHNALIQVAADLGIFGLLAFMFLIGRAATAAARTRRLLSKPRRRNQPDVLAQAMDDRERQTLYSHTAAMTAGLVGWFACAFFASVAYSWTFYYLLALTVVARELTVARLATVGALARQAAKRSGAGVATISRRVANGVA